MANPLDFLPLTFGIILVLEVGFALPIRNDKCTEDIEDTSTNFHFGAVTDEFIHSTAMTDDVFERVDELGFGLHRIDVNDVGIAPYEDLGKVVTIDGGNS